MQIPNLKRLCCLSLIAMLAVVCTNTASAKNSPSVYLDLNSQSAYQIASIQFLPDYEYEDRFGPDPSKYCTDYQLTYCPTNAKCSKCPANLNRYRIDSCDQGYQMSYNEDNVADSCVSVQCPSGSYEEVPFWNRCMKKTINGLTCYGSCSIVKCDRNTYKYSCSKTVEHGKMVKCADCTSAGSTVTTQRQVKSLGITNGGTASSVDVIPGGTATLAKYVSNCGNDYCAIECDQGYELDEASGKCVALDDTCPFGYGKNETECSYGLDKTNTQSTQAGNLCYKCQAPNDNCPTDYVKNKTECQYGASGITATTEAGTTCYQCNKNDTCPVGFAKNKAECPYGATPTTTDTEAGTTCYGCYEDAKSGCEALGYYTQDYWDLKKPGNKLDLISKIFNFENASHQFAYIFNNLLGTKEAYAYNLQEDLDDPDLYKCPVFCRNSATNYYNCNDTQCRGCTACAASLDGGYYSPDFIGGEVATTDYEFEITATCPYDANYVKGEWVKVEKTNDSTCEGYDLVECPANGTCSECVDDGTTKYKLTGCNAGYKQNGSSCVATCNVTNCGSEYKYTSCPTGANCSSCTATTSDCTSTTKFKITGCKTGYKLSNGTCVKDDPCQTECNTLYSSLQCKSACTTLCRQGQNYYNISVGGLTCQMR